MDRVELNAKYNLPEGWFAEMDAKTGRCYFWNIHTKERTWVQPDHDAKMNGSDNSSAGSLSSPLSAACNISGGNESNNNNNNKRQRAPTDGLPDPSLAPPAPEQKPVASSSSSSTKRSSFVRSLSGRERSRSKSDSVSSGSSGGKPGRKNKLKDFMSMIGKKTSFSRDKKRRENVMAERGYSCEPSGSEKEVIPVTYPKSAKTKSLLLDILRGQYLFQSLNHDEMSRVVDMMGKQEVKAGVVLIQQGDRGDFFYVVEKGRFDVLQQTRESDEVKKVGLIDAGGSFGELALLYGQKRAATVQATADSVVWKLDRHAFRAMLRRTMSHGIREARQALRSVPLLSVLTDEQIDTCADVVRFMEFAKGDKIIKKGEIGDVFYIIQTGQVEVSGGVSLKQGESTSAVLGPHHFFGERALLKDEARAANVVALTDVVCLVLDRYAFTTILGPLREVLDNNIRNTVFKQLDLFRHLEDSEVEKVFQAFSVQSFEAGTFIIRQNELASAFYVLRSGEAKVLQTVAVDSSSSTTATSVVNKLSVGDYFGEMGLVEKNGKREASVQAATHCECFVLDRQSFESLLGQTADSILHRDMKKRREQNEVKRKEAQILHQQEQDLLRQQQLLLEQQEAYAAVSAQQQQQQQHGQAPPIASISDAMEVETQQQEQQQQQQPGGTWGAGAPRTNYDMSDLEPIKTLGTGTFGRVQLVKHKVNQETYALKVQSKAQITKYKLQGNILSEKLILAGLSHPFIIALYQTMQSRDLLYMLLEVVQGGELFSFLQNYGANLQAPHHKFYMACMISAFHYLHSKHILYRDLKPENILIDKTGYLKLVDFGFAKFEKHRTFTLCGTPEYFSPELVLGKGYGKSNDIWALGILMYEMINGYTPFGGPDDNQNEICKRIVKQPLMFPEDLGDGEAKRLIASLLRKDPLKRLGGGLHGMNEVMAHPWLRQVNWTHLNSKMIQAPWIPPIQGDTDCSLFDDYDENFAVEPYLETGPAAAWTLQF